MTVKVGPLSALPKWFRAHSPTMDEARLAMLTSCVEGLADSELDLPLLVAAAHGDGDASVLDAMDEALVACTPTYPADRAKDELCTMAAAALILLMSTTRMTSGAESEKEAILTALFVQSSTFAGGAPVLNDLTVAAERCLTDRASAARARLSNETAARAVAKLAKSEREEGAQDLETLHALVQERDAAIGILARRLEQLVESFNHRLNLLDEEVDILWWARSAVSSTNGTPWVELQPLDRAVIAVMEIEQLVKEMPPTSGTLAVLTSVVDSGEATYDFIDLLIALDAAQVVLKAEYGDRLMPLANGLSVYRRFQGERDVINKALDASGAFGRKATFSAQDLAEQFLRERSIEALG